MKQYKVYQIEILNIITLSWLQDMFDEQIGRYAEDKIHGNRSPRDTCIQHKLGSGLQHQRPLIPPPPPFVLHIASLVRTVCTNAVQNTTGLSEF